MPNRDTTNWYEGKDPVSVVDMSLIDILRGVAGASVLDLGCGIGGYSKVLERHGHRCLGLDVNQRYVDVARGIGVDAAVYDGITIPFPDRHFDTTFAIEVLEHVADPMPLLSEIRRVTRRNFVATVPNCTQSLGTSGVVFEHMLDADHKNFFDASSFDALLRSAFGAAEVIQVAPINVGVATALLPKPLVWQYRALLKLGLVRPTHFFRLVGICEIDASA